MTRPVVLAMGVCHRDVDLAALWCRWVNFLAQYHDSSEYKLLIVYTHRAEPKIKAATEAFHGTLYGEFKTRAVKCPDEDESGYPRSASHLFLRTLEEAEATFPGHAVLWCEPDTVPMKPTWFEEIVAEYQTCGKPFLGMLVGTHHPHLSGNAVYPANWRELAPLIAKAHKAPDHKLWGPRKGQPWDVFCRKETTPQMAESRLLQQEWKDRDARGTRLADIRPETCLFHQDKAGALIREIARTRYPEFMATLAQPRKFYFMNGHPSRLSTKGVRVRFSFTKWTPSGHRTCVCSDELDNEEAAAIAALVGQLGVREIDQAEFLSITGRHVSTLPEPRVRTVTTTPMLATKKPMAPRVKVYSGPPRIFHAVDPFGSDARHHAAQATWNYDAGFIAAHLPPGGRDAAAELGDPRKLPFLKDILWSAIPDDSSTAGDAIIMFTNSDTGLSPGLVETVRKHIGQHHAASMRRTESNGAAHPGRDLFAFTVDWLHEHWDRMPDYVVGAPVFDLGLIAMIRKFHQQPFSLKSCTVDLAPADMPPGGILHQSHDPEWRVENMDSVPSVRHNKKLLREWAARHAPEIGFSKGGNLK